VEYKMPSICIPPVHERKRGDTEEKCSTAVSHNNVGDQRGLGNIRTYLNTDYYVYLAYGCKDNGEPTDMLLP